MGDILLRRNKPQPVFPHLLGGNAVIGKQQIVNVKKVLVFRIFVHMGNGNVAFDILRLNRFGVFGYGLGAENLHFVNPDMARHLELKSYI